MSTQQSTSHFLLSQTTSPRGMKQEWRPVHPFLRGVSALLSAVLAFTCGGPVHQAFGQTKGTIIANTDGETLILNSDNGSIVAGTVTSGSSVDARSLFELTIAPGSLFSGDTPIGALTLGSGTQGIVVGKLNFLHSVASTASGSAFDNTDISVDPGVKTLTLNGLSLPYGGTLSFGKWNTANGGTGTGIGVKVLLGVGTAQAAQTWTIGGTRTKSPTVLAAFFDENTAAYAAARVENSESVVKTLTISTFSPEPNLDDSATLSSAWLDVGPNINIKKITNGGILYLKRESISETATDARFKGEILIAGGAVQLEDRFLTTDSSGGGSTIKFDATTESPVLKVVGANSVTAISELLTREQNADGVEVPKYRPTISGASSGEIEGGSLTLELGVTNLELESNLIDGFDKAPLSIVKRGTSTFTPLNSSNSFSGGLTIGAGTLAITRGGDPAAVDADEYPLRAENGKLYSPVGVGTLTFDGGTAGATLLVGTSGVTSVQLSNDVTFKGSSDLATISKAVIKAGDANTTTSLSLSGLVKVEGPEELDPTDLTESIFLPTKTNVELDLSTSLTLAPDPDFPSPSGLLVNGTLRLTGGGSLSLSAGLDQIELGDFVLRNGTLLIGQEALNSGVSIIGTDGNRRIQLAGADVRIEAGEFNNLPIWESNFTFSGGSSTLEISSDSGKNVVAIRNRVRVTVEDGTLALGGVQKAPGAEYAGLAKSGLGTLEFKEPFVLEGEPNLDELEFLGGQVFFSSTQASVFAGSVALSGEIQIASFGSLSLTGAVRGDGFEKTGEGALDLGKNNNISGPIIVRAGSLTLGAGAGSFFVGNAQTQGFDAPTLVVSSNSTVSGAVTVGTGATTTAYTVTLASSGTSGVSAFSGPITLSGDLANISLLAATGGTLDFTNIITTNNKAISVGGDENEGTIRLSRTLSTTGLVSVKKGTLQLGAGLTADAEVDSGAVLRFEQNNDLTYSGTLSRGTLGAGTLEQAGTGVLTLAKSQSAFDGTLLLTQGTTVWDTNAAGIVFNGGALRPTVDVSTKIQALTGQDARIDVAAGQSVSFATALTGNGGLTKTGAGALTLSQKPEYTGTTTISAGSLTISSSEFLNGSRPITNNGFLNLTLSTGTYNGTLGGTGTLNLTASESVILTLGKDATLSGNIVLNENVTLDLSLSESKLGADTSLTIGSGAFVKIGTTTREFSSLSFGSTGKLLGDANSKILYASLDDKLTLTDAGYTLNDDYASTNILFELSARPERVSDGALKGLLVTAGRAGGLEPGEANLDYLLLKPKTEKTKVTINQPLTLNQRINAVVGDGLTKGLVSIENTLTLISGSIQFAAGIEATLTQSGSLNATGGLVNEGSLIVNASSEKTVEIAIQGAGSLQKTGLGLLRLTGKNNYTGKTTLTTGVLELGSDTALGTSSLVFAGGTLGYGATFTPDVSGRIADLAQGTVANIDTAGKTVTFGTGLKGNGGIAKLGAGKLVLTGANEFLGVASVQEGTLQVGNGGSTGSLAKDAAVSEEAVLRFERSSDLTYSGALSGTGTVEQAGTGVLTLEGTNSAFDGTLLLSKGVLALAGASSSGGSTPEVAFNGGTLRTTSDLSAKLISSGGAIANIEVADAGAAVSFAYSLSEIAGLNKLGAGTLELTGNKTYTGETTVSAGFLNAGSALVSTSAINVNGGIFEAISYNPAAKLTIGTNGTAQFNAETLLLEQIENSGTLLFTEAVAYLDIQKLSGTGKATFAGAGSAVVTELNGSLDLNNNKELSVEQGTLTGSLSGSGSLYKIGGSKNFYLQGPTSFTGETVVQDGTLFVSGAANLAASTRVKVEGEAQFLNTTGTTRLKELAGGNQNAPVGAVKLFGNTIIDEISQFYGSIDLASTGSLNVTGGTYAGTLAGSGTLIKTGSSALSLIKTPATELNVNVQAGSLNATALLDGARTVSVSVSGQLNNQINGGTYSGKLTSAGETILTGADTLSLGVGARVQGNLTLASGVTLDISKSYRQAGNTLASDGGIQAESSLTLKDGSALVLDTPTMAVELELINLKLDRGSKLKTLSQASATQGTTIVYENIPVSDLLNSGVYLPILDPETNLLLGDYEILRDVAAGGTLRFEENSKPGLIFGGGTYEYVAGRVKTGTNATKEVPTTGVVNRLLLSPLTGKTVRISSLIPTRIQEEVVAGGTGAFGFVNVGTLVTTRRFVINENILATFSGAGALSPDGTFVNSGTLQFSVLSDSKVTANLIAGAGTLEKVGAGTLELSGVNSYTGTTRLSGGYIQLNNSNALGNNGGILFNGGGLRYGEGQTVDLSSRFRPIDAGQNGVIDTGSSNTVNFGSVISGSGGLVKAGQGTLVLRAAETFTGALSVNEGSVKVGSGTVGSLKADANVAGGAVLSFDRSNETEYAGALTGEGKVQQAGSGTLNLTGNGRAFQGNFELARGTTVIGGSGALAGGTVTFAGGILKYATDEATDISGRINLAQTALVDTGTYNVVYGESIKGNAGLSKYGAGTLTLSGNNSYTGSTAVVGGVLQYNNNGLTSAGTVETQTGTTVKLSDDGDTTFFSGVVKGSGQLVKEGSGSLTLQKSQLNTGGLILSRGTLVVDAAVRLKGSVTVGEGTVLNKTNGIFDSSTALVLGGTLELGNGVSFVKSLTLNSQDIILDPDLADGDFAAIYAESLQGITFENTDSVVVGSFAKGSFKGALRGAISGIPDGTNFTLEKDTSGRLAKLSDPSMKLGSLIAEAGVNLEIAENVEVSGNVLIKGGTVLVSNGLNAPSSNVVFGEVTTSGSGKVTASVANGGSIVARELTLTGSSVLTLDNNPTALEKVPTIQVGAFTEDESKLIIDSGTLTLAPGQTLMGSGTIQGNVTLGANSVLSPGNSPGTLYFAGNLDLASGTIRIEVGTSLQDQIDVSGATVSIGAPTFQIVDTDGVLASGGTLLSIFVGGTPALNGGTFSFARKSSSGVVLPSVMYLSNASLGALQIQRLKFASFAGAAPNIAGFATALDTRILTQQAATDGLLELGTGIVNTDALPAQLAAAMPVVYAETAALSTQRTLNIHQGLVGHFSSLRANLRETPEGVYNAWSTGYGASSKQNGDRALGTAGFTASSWGDLFGVEQRVGGFLLGVTGAAGRTTANFANNPGRATTDSWHGGLYSVLDLESFLVESGVLYGTTDTRARRTISAPGLTTREGRVTLSGNEWVANFGLSKPIAASPALTLTPSLRLIAQGQSQNAAKESDLSGLEVAIAKQSSTTLLHQAAVELRRKLNLAGRPAAASLQLDWIHNYSTKGRSLDMALSGNPAASYGYRGSDAGADAFQVGAAFEAALTERTVLRLGGEYQSQTGLSTVRGSVSLGYQF